MVNGLLLDCFSSEKVGCRPELTAIPATVCVLEPWLAFPDISDVALQATSAFVVRVIARHLYLLSSPVVSGEMALDQACHDIQGTGKRACHHSDEPYCGHSERSSV